MRLTGADLDALIAARAQILMHGVLKQFASSTNWCVLVVEQSVCGSPLTMTRIARRIEGDSCSFDTAA